MFNWLRNYFSVTERAENIRLKAEVDFWKEQFEKAKNAEMIANEKLFKEIASNRRREDAKNAKILELSGVRERLPERSENQTDDNNDDDGDNNDSDLKDTEVKAIADELSKQAIESGRTVTDDTYRQLFQAIKDNPSEYGL